MGVIQLLIDRGGDINAVAEDGATPASKAVGAFSGCKCMEALVAAGANLHAGFSVSRYLMLRMH
eukprot:m.38863 g.38863  ORF g.38863 m.38863 type:complete len:64 (-) comp12621_c0_seq10:307-498(-)